MEFIRINSFQTTTQSPGEEVAEVAAQAASSLGVSMVGMMGMVMMMGNMNFQQSGQATGNSPSPGAVGGGGLPTNAALPTLAA